MIFTVTVKPGSKKGDLVVPDSESQLTVYLRARAIEGRANEALVILLARHFQVKRWQVKIVSGAKSRKKIVEIQ